MMYLAKAARVSLLLALMTVAPGLLSAQRQCNTNTLLGSYALRYTSGVPGSPTYGMGVGVTTFDGNGGGGETETVTVNGTIMRGVRSSVAYTVKSDCTGAITWTYPDFGGLVVRADIVILDNGRTIYTIGTDNGSVSSGVYTKL